MTTPRWIVQDVFSSGRPGPAYTVHDDFKEAHEEAIRRDGALLPLRECETCGSTLGIDGKGLDGTCIYCR